MAGKLVWDGKEPMPIYGLNPAGMKLVTGKPISQADAIRKYRQDMGLAPLPEVVTDPHSRSLNAVEGEG